MKEPTQARTIVLSESSWQLLDAAAELWDGRPDEILDSVVQGFTATDGGALVKRKLALFKFQELFGNNHG